MGSTLARFFSWAFLGLIALVELPSLLAQETGAGELYRGTPGGPYVAHPGDRPIQIPPAKYPNRVAIQKVYPLKLARVEFTNSVTRFSLKYRIEVELVDGGTRLVDDGHDFRTGDKFRIHLQSNFRGYVYVLLNDPEGDWKLLIPNPRLPAGSNFIGPEGAILPASSSTSQNSFQMQGKEGLEKLYIFVSPLPIPEIDQWVASGRTLSSLTRDLGLDSIPELRRMERAPDSTTRFRTIGIVQNQTADVKVDLNLQDVLLFEKLDDGNYVAFLSNRPDAILRWKIVLKHTQ